MDKQKGFVISRGVIVVAALIILGFIIWLLTQNASQPAAAPSGEQGQPQTQEQLTPEEQIEKNDSQVKEDLARMATSITEYVSNNGGNYPANAQQLDEVLRNYVVTKPFLSPLTQNSYILTLSKAREAGVINLERGTCNAQQNGVVPTQNTRTYAVLTILTDKSVYCIDI